MLSYTREQLVNGATFSNHDVEEIKRCHRDYNRLGWLYRKLFMKIQFAYLWAQLSSKARELLKGSFCRDP